MLSLCESSGRSGCVEFHTEFVARFRLGATVQWVDRLEDGTINAIAGPETLVLRRPVALHREVLKRSAGLTVASGQLVPFVLSYGASVQSPPPAIDPFNALDARKRSGVNGAIGVPKWALDRSGESSAEITLKALTYTHRLVGSSPPSRRRFRSAWAAKLDPLLLAARRDSHAWR